LAGSAGRIHWCFDEGRIDTKQTPGQSVTEKLQFMSQSLSDEATVLAEIKRRVLAFAQERDWEQFHTPKNLSMALAAEAAELMEHFLWVDGPASHCAAQEPKRRQKIEEELADIVIYALEFANIAKIDVSAAIERKMQANAQKYPVEKARGRSEKYTEL
jgi:dCTP diphosphatase